MDLSLSAEQKLIQETAGRIAAEVLAPRAAELDNTYSFPTENLKKLAEAGMLGMLIPPPFGRGGASTLSFTLATEELAKACGSTALSFVTHVSAAQGILIAGTSEQRAKYLPALAKGEKLGAFAVTEPNSGANPMALEAFAESRPDHYLLNGSKAFITNAGEAAVNLVMAKTDRAPGPQSLSLFIVDSDLPGVSFGKTVRRMGFNGVSCREIIFQDVKVPRENLLGQPGMAVPLTMGIGALAALGAAAISVGLAQAALAASTTYAKERKILGQPIGANQAIQFYITEMSTAIDAARALLQSAVYLRDTSPPGPPIPALKAKLFASEMAVDVTNRALQIHGGTGYTKELPVERYYRDARGVTLHFSTTELIKDLLGKIALGLFP
ncbi:MAG: acyl-CoA dehydrogenase family protein [Chloroflexi bacterium]|nr:acyl-CoA dehydrogenase family protein [Chloroflexota bacterium]